jgi:hypothetical protein
MRLRFLVFLLWSFAVVIFLGRPVFAMLESAAGGKAMLQGLSYAVPARGLFPCLRNTPLDTLNQAAVKAGIEHLRASTRLSPTHSPPDLLLGEANCLLQDKPTAAQFISAYHAANPQGPWGEVQQLSNHIDWANTDSIRSGLQNRYLTASELINLYSKTGQGRSTHIWH